MKCQKNQTTEIFKDLKIKVSYLGRDGLVCQIFHVYWFACVCFISAKLVLAEKVLVEDLKKCQCFFSNLLYAYVFLLSNQFTSRPTPCMFQSFNIFFCFVLLGEGEHCQVHHRPEGVGQGHSGQSYSLNCHRSTEASSSPGLIARRRDITFLCRINYSFFIDCLCQRYGCVQYLHVSRW